MALRPVRSDADDQTMRPPMLKRLKRPAKPPPTAAEAPNMSWHIGDAWPRMPIPAVTFRQSTVHRSQNCGVLQAASTATFACVISFLGWVGGVYPAGRQPGAGTRTVNAPNIMKAK